ncbi:hypothetical protein EV356DRAFT_528652 [Viridothelium virens]|uniref:Uncharacterized protein n=1 Tax=Viridothelium virens TaxID=1048519 RepID=A0A6A6HNE6_VIRVR|nr:hypothetical protein EV356DRAFT_528652 [Viridothelium virens]
MTAARLRKAFRYPSESDSDGPVEGIDEEEQDKVISKLNTQDAVQNALYTKAFLALALLPLPWYLTTLFSQPTTQDLLVVIISITSLLSTAYIVYFMPPRKIDKKGKRPVYIAEREEAVGPVRKYLISLVAALCTALAINGISVARKLGHDEPWITNPQIWWTLLPSVIFGLVMFARSQMTPIDTAELQRARYPYKGA